MISGSVFSHIKRILLSLGKNAFLGNSKPVMGPNMELSPHRFRLPTGSPHRHHRKEEDPHLHTRDRYKSKA
jgi:hypothetical protein